MTEADLYREGKAFPALCSKCGKTSHLFQPNAEKLCVCGNTIQSASVAVVFDELKTLLHPTLADVHRIYRKWLHVTDEKRIDVVLATALTNRIKGTPVWLIVVGASGDWKTEQILALNHPEKAKLAGSITPNTLITGDKRAESLAPKLDGKLFLVKDMAQLLTLPPDHKAAIWAQLRDLFDGKISKATGTGVDLTFEVYTTLIAAATPAIDEQILQGQALGTRELIWRTDLDEEGDELATMEKVLANEEQESRMREELNTVTNRFLDDRRFGNIALSPLILDYIKNAAQFIAIMRAVGETDYDGNLRNLVYPEKPTRVLKQLKRIAQALAALDDDYPDERIKEVISHLARSVAHRIRLNLMEVLTSEDGRLWTTNGIAHAANCGYKSATSHLCVLRSVGMVERLFSEEQNSFGRVVESVHWRATPKTKDFLTSLRVISKPHQISLYANDN